MQTPRRFPDRARSVRTAEAAVRPPGARTALPLCLCAAMGATALHVSAAERDLDAHEHGAATLDIALDGARLYLDLDTPAANVLGFEHAPSTDAQRESVAEAERVLGAGGLFVPDAAADCALEDVTVAIELPDAPDGEDGDAHEHGDEHGDTDGHDEEHEEGHEDGDAEGHDEEHDGGDAEGRDEEHEDGDAEGHEGEHEDADAEGHDEEHEEGHEDGDAEGHAGHDDERAAGAVHSDITVSHVLLCGNPDALGTLETTLFDRYDGFEDIDVQLVGPGGQDGARLTADSPALSLELIL